MPRRWIFRGHANAKWKLQPTALRTPSPWAKYRLTGANTTDWGERQQAVEFLLDSFQKYLDRSGIVIPTPIAPVKDGSELEPGGLPRRRQWPLMSLAQHHGLPTFLLDWTRHGRNAAYFAASAICDPETRDRGDDLAVWALQLNVLRQVFQQPPRHLEVYEAPGCTNPNLRAQAGLFTVLGIKDDAIDSIDDYVKKFGDETGVKLLLLTLKAKHAPALLRLVADEGVDGASMFPGVDGVVRAMREYAWWDRIGAGGIAELLTPWS
jgi:hypothetical protein